MAQLTFPLDSQTKAVIFDKDGTLINFHLMWATWMTDLVRRLEQATHTQFGQQLLVNLGYDPSQNRVIPGSALAIATLDEMRTAIVEAMTQVGISEEQAAYALRQTWYLPDPVALAEPLTDLNALFTALNANGIKVAVATADDHAPADATLAGLGVASFVEMVVGADDMPPKPQPHAILAICEHLGIEPSQSVMVGDSPVDMLMGRAAGAGLCVGVASGIHTAAELEEYADIVIDSIRDLFPH
jgi:phosphoglycolate phosphatase